MQKAVRSVQGAHFQTCRLLGLPVTIAPNSTLNQKFNIETGVEVADTSALAMRYITIGNGGHRMVVGANGQGKATPVQHQPRYAALYSHLPFVLRPIANDLTQQQIVQYRLRRIEEHNSQPYVAYYAKVLDLSTTRPQQELRSVTDSLVTATDYVPSLSDLNPTPPNLAPGSALVTSGDYIASSAKVPVNLTAFDMQELLNVCNILYGDEDYAIISEMGLCTGADKIVTGSTSTGSLSYTEAVMTQISCFMNTLFSASASNNGQSVVFDVGATEPLTTVATV